MPDYLLYCFEGHKLLRCDRFSAVDDEEAVADALRRHDGKAAELWCGTRKVDDFPGPGEPPFLFKGRPKR